MTKLFTVLAAGGALALASMAAPTTADARCFGCGVAAGVIGGAAVGAAIAGGPGYYGYGAYDGAYDYAPGYYGGPGYYDNSYAYYGYRHHRRGGPHYSTGDITNRSRQLQGTR